MANQTPDPHVSLDFDRAEIDEYREWLEVDGLGGYAMGTLSGVRTRRYHALLMPATAPPSGRVALVNGFDAWIEWGDQRIALTPQRYTPDVLTPAGGTHRDSFSGDPWPRWTYDLGSGFTGRHELFLVHGAPVVVLGWNFANAPSGAHLFVRPFLAGRDMHSLQQWNGAFQFAAQQDGERVTWKPYSDLPSVISLSSGEYSHDPQWYQNFQYDRERDRGLDFSEDLGSPGTLRFDLSQGDPVWILAAGGEPAEGRIGGSGSAAELANRFREEEAQRRKSFPSAVHRAADRYLAKRGDGLTLIAGFPWFGDWGRDTFISLRGLCLAAGRLDEARQILLAWSQVVSQGMLPNYFPEGNAQAEYNSVDASLWYVVGVHDLVAAFDAAGRDLEPSDVQSLQAAVGAILEGYSAGTRFGIRADEDGLLTAGAPGYQLTWMDARVGDWVVTPRRGKPVEVQALWINALTIGSAFDAKWKAPLERARASFQERFWNAEQSCLYDVVDVEGEPGTVDPTFRPNQIFAVGGLPVACLDDAVRARAMVDAVEERLRTPYGLRSLAPGEENYVPVYEGDPGWRDGHYHQGPVWPWLAGPFVEAWLRVRENSADAVAQARTDFLAPMLQQLRQDGVGHVSELTDAQSPWSPRGAPFQAWSLGELMRVLALCGGV